MTRIAHVFVAFGCLVACGAPAPPSALTVAPPLDAGSAMPPAPSAIAAPDAGPVGAPTACEGPSVDLLAAIADPACRISEAEADRLREVLEDPARTPLRVDATVTDGTLRQLIVVNTGAAPVALPLLVHSHLDAFPAMASSFPLAPPEPAWPAGFTFDTGRMLAKVVLPPGGRALAQLRLDLSSLEVVRKEVRDCPPDAKCAPDVVQRRPLPPGVYTLRFRTPLYAMRKDLEARVQWATRPACPGPAACPPGKRSVPGCSGGMRPRPEDCPPADRCVPANAPIPACPAVP